MRIKYFSSVIAFSIFYCLILYGRTFAAPIPPEVKSVVVFIFIEKKGDLIPNGTAFFVGVKNPSEQSRFSVYLITSKHVLYKPDTTEFLDKVFIRINKKEGGRNVSMKMRHRFK